MLYITTEVAQWWQHLRASDFHRTMPPLRATLTCKTNEIHNKRLLITVLSGVYVAVKPDNSDQTVALTVHVRIIQVHYTINNTVIVLSPSVLLQLQRTQTTQYTIFTNKAIVLSGIPGCGDHAPPVAVTTAAAASPWRPGAGLLQTFIMYLQIKMAQTCAL